MPEGTTFVRFPKPGNIRENMTQWQKQQEKLKTEKAKSWQYLCGRKDFTKLKQITKDTYTCSLHFVDGKSLTDEDADPILATHTDSELENRRKHKRKAPEERVHHDQAKCRRRLNTDKGLPENNALNFGSTSSEKWESFCTSSDNIISKSVKETQTKTQESHTTDTI